MTSKTNRSRTQRNRHHHSLAFDVGSFREAAGFQVWGVSERILEYGIEARRK